VSVCSLSKPLAKAALRIPARRWREAPGLTTKVSLPDRSRDVHSNYSALRDTVAVATSSAHEFFAVAAGVAGTLIGLLFVALSVSRDKIVGPDASEVHAVRAAATLTAFTNALTVALFSLVPGVNVGRVAEVVASLGLLFVAGGLIHIVPDWRAKRLRLREITFLIGLLAVFVIQLIAGIGLEGSRHDSSDLETICVLVIVCFLIGISRAWGLVGGPTVGLAHEIAGRLDGHDGAEQADGAEDG
jgi:hypothetical protein